MWVPWYKAYQARLWERLLTSRGLPSDSTCVLKAEPGNLISIAAYLVFYLSVYPLLKTLQTRDYDVIFCVVLTGSLATSSWPDKGNMQWDRKCLLLGYVETIQLILGVTDKAFFMLSSTEQDYTRPQIKHNLYFCWNNFQTTVKKINWIWKICCKTLHQ